jgi:hypothetical protein
MVPEHVVRDAKKPRLEGTIAIEGRRCRRRRRNTSWVRSSANDTSPQDLLKKPKTDR